MADGLDVAEMALDGACGRRSRSTPNAVDQVHGLHGAPDRVRAGEQVDRPLLEVRALAGDGALPFLLEGGVQKRARERTSPSAAPTRAWTTVRSRRERVLPSGSWLGPAPAAPRSPRGDAERDRGEEDRGRADGGQAIEGRRSASRGRRRGEGETSSGPARTRPPRPRRCCRCRASPASPRCLRPVPRPPGGSRRSHPRRRWRSGTASPRRESCSRRPPAVSR